MALNWNEEQTRRRMLAVPVAYFFFYLLYFTLLQEYARPKFWVYTELDAYIPFFEGFVIPYVLWFPLVPLMFLYFHRRDPESYVYLCRTILTGLTLCLLIYTVLPNGQLLRRPLPRDNILVPTGGAHPENRSTHQRLSLHPRLCLGHHRHRRRPGRVPTGTQGGPERDPHADYPHLHVHHVPQATLGGGRGLRSHPERGAGSAGPPVESRPGPAAPGGPAPGRRKDRDGDLRAGRTLLTG